MPSQPEIHPVAPSGEGNPSLIDGLLKILEANVEPRAPKSKQPKKELNVTAEKKKANEVIARLKQGVFPKDEMPKTPEIREKILREQLASGNTQGFIKEVQDIPNDPKILDVLTDILTAPPELQNDSRWLLAKGAEIRSAMRTDMPIDQQKAARTILKNIYQKIAAIESVDMGDPIVRTSKDPEVRGKVEFVELAGNSLLPEAGVMPVPGPATASNAVENIFQDSGDPLAGSFLERELREIKFRLVTDAHSSLHDTHKLARFQQEIEDAAVKQGGFDSPGVQREVREAKQRIQAVIDEALAAQQARLSIRGRESRMPVDDKDRDWIYEKDAAGNPEKPPDVPGILPDGSTVVMSKQPLRDMLESFEGNANARDEHIANDMIKALQDLAKADNYISIEDIRPYVAKIHNQIKTTRSLHWVPDHNEMALIAENWVERDKIFYKRIEEVLTSSFEQAREVMNLYAEGGVDAFIAAVREAHPGEVGRKMAARYLHLKKSIYFNHDLELITRGSAGEVELLKKLAAMSHTSFMREAVSDPITQSMLGSMEQALRKILRDHDGYLPPDLFTVRNGSTFWDELGMQFFKEKVLSGTVYDFKRKPDGSPVDKPSNVGFEVGDLFTIEHFNNQSLRLLAAQQQAKGIGMLTNRLLELFASAKAPGFETTDSSFSSIPYEGIARFFRPKAHLFGKYKFADLSHKSVFATIVGARMPELVNFVKWSPEDCDEVSRAVASGELSDWLEKKYGKTIGEKIYKEAKPFTEIVDEFFWTGRFGPHSAWGEIDATLYWTDLMREKEGGSVRIGRAEWWADRYLGGKDATWWKDHYPKLKKTSWDDLKNTKEGREIRGKLARAYKAWTWAQMTLRSPEIVAENVFSTTNGVQAEKKNAPDLRKMLIRQILGIDLDTQVSTEATPNQTQMNFMNRIAVLDVDVAAIQRAALYGGVNGAPRDIVDADYNILKLGRKDPNNAWSVTEEQRRSQAKNYIESVHRQVLGNWQTIGDWQRELGISFGRERAMDRQNHPKVDAGGNPVFMDDMLQIANFEQIDAILARHGGKLTKELLDRPQYYYMGMDDMRIEDMDITNLGERAFSRLNNDLDARQQAVGIMGKLFDEFRPHMDEKTVLKLLGDLYNVEKGGRGPDSGRAFVYYFARLFGEYYRGDKYTKIPIVGRILQRYGPPSSIAQEIHRKEKGDVWSINNEKAWLHKVAQIAALPGEELEANGTQNKYSIERLERELVAGDAWAIAEMAIIGVVLTSMVVSFSAVTKQVEEGVKH